MIIQCPECKSRYRTQVLPEGQASARVKCPKCEVSFVIGPEGHCHGEASRHKETILLVDDARFFRDLMVDLLSDRAANLITADSAEDAWDKLQKQSFDLLVVDINLPDKNGLELIRDIRANKRLADLPILCISGVYRKDDDAAKALRAGADDFISKSFKPDELNERIDKLLNK